MGESRPFVERLSHSIETLGHALCAGLDPWWDMMPAEVTAGRDTLSEKAAACREYCVAVIDQLVGVVGVVKPQSAYFEQYGSAGVAAFHDVARYARSKGLLVIGDVKRGDIGSTASAYAQSLFRPDPADGCPVFDAVTVNPFFGSDGVKPFLEQAQKTNSGVFLLLRTSNPSSAELQELLIDGRPMYAHLADLIAGWVEELEEPTKYSLAGVVVGATQEKVIEELRHRLPRCWFLMPGVGAQGAGADACAAATDSGGEGALVTVARGLLFPWRSKENLEAPENWREAIAASAREWAVAASSVRCDR